VEIIRAKNSGFCFGVDRAINLAFTEAEKTDRSGRLLTCGHLIHNAAVVERLESMGVRMITSLDEAEPEDTVIVRSHGEPEEFYRKAEERGITLIDTTCVFVKKIHEIVKEAHEAGRPVVVIGDRNHQEVIATNGWCGYDALIIGDAEEAKEALPELKKRIESAKNGGRTETSTAADDRNAPESAVQTETANATDDRNAPESADQKETSTAADDRNAPESAESVPVVVCQTTIKQELLDSILEVFDGAGIGCEIRNTICNATRDRQESCRELSGQVDLMVVIGDRHSSNSRKLFEIAQKNCQKSIFIENASDSLLKDAEKYNKIGVIAGASTPEWIIKEVISRMSENVTMDKDYNPMNDYLDDITKSTRLPKPGEIIEGKVDQVMENQVIVNMGCKKDGILKADEVVLEEGQKLSDVFKEGDEIQAKVIKSDDGEGGILLSRKRLAAVENYKELEAALESKEIINVKILRAVNGGVIAAYKEITGFIPMSQLSDRYVENADEFIGQNVDVRVIRVDSARNRAVFSRKTVIAEQKRKQIEEIWENLNVGDVVQGKVMRFTDYGAFVDIGGIDGLLHISEISWGKLKHPEEVLKIGEIINVKILSLKDGTDKGQNNKKVSLGLKQTQPEPWTLVGEKYQVGDIIEGKVVQTKDYGAFVELEAGLDGLVHISEIANKRVENVSNELKVGQIVKVRIQEIDPDKRRISLSIKAALPEDEPAQEEEVPAAEEAPVAEEPAAEAPAEVAEEAAEAAAEVADAE